jgi:hypothetical protein
MNPPPQISNSQPDDFTPDLRLLGRIFELLVGDMLLD